MDPVKASIGLIIFEASSMDGLVAKTFGKSSVADERFSELIKSLRIVQAHVKGPVISRALAYALFTIAQHLSSQSPYETSWDLHYDTIMGLCEEILMADTSE